MVTQLRKLLFLNPFEVRVTVNIQPSFQGALCNSKIRFPSCVFFNLSWNIYRKRQIENDKCKGKIDKSF